MLEFSSNSKGRTARNVTEPIDDLKCLKILGIQDFEGYGRKDLSWGWKEGKTRKHHDLSGAVNSTYEQYLQQYLKIPTKKKKKTPVLCRGKLPLGCNYVRFAHPVQDWKQESISPFMDLIYFGQMRHSWMDTICRNHLLTSPIPSLGRVCGSLKFQQRLGFSYGQQLCGNVSPQITIASGESLF